MKYDFLCDNLLLICPNSIKNTILKYLFENKLMYQIKFMSKEEYLKKKKFDYDEKTINYLVHKNMKVDNAISLIKNLYYIDEQYQDNIKMKQLIDIKRELDDNNLLIYDHIFNNTFKIVVYGYGKLSSYEKKLFPLDTDFIEYPLIDREYLVYQFSDISMEVEFVFQRIVDLLKNGIDINQISIMNIDNEYLPYLKKYSFFYHLPIDTFSSDYLIGTRIGKIVYDLLNEVNDLNDLFNKINIYSNCVNYKKIVDILNKYVAMDFCEIKEMIIFDLYNTKINSENLTNVIKIKDFFDDVLKSEYVFLVNFNNSSLPKFCSDTDYFSDIEKNKMGFPTSLELNKLLKENSLKYLSNISNLTISYKNHSPFNNFYPSILLDEMSYSLENSEYSYNYSVLSNKYHYGLLLDNYLKYGEENEELKMLYNNYPDYDYMKYENNYKKIDNTLLNKIINNELVLSYSSINNYYECQFKYLLSNLLKIDLYEETFQTIIGNLFHNVLRNMNNKDFDFEKEYSNFISNYDFSNKEKYFISKLKSDLEYVIKVIKKYQIITGFNQELYEKKVDIILKNEPFVHFKGFVDKIMYKENGNETLVSVIDYKTGNPDIKIKDINYGLSMQLPVYLYLIKNSNLFSNIKFTGFYLQHILNTDIKIVKNKTYDMQRDENLKLTGYSTNDINRLSIFDSTYEDSEMIKGLKVTKQGKLSYYSHTLDDKEIDNIIETVEKKINEACDLILNGEFNINPKIINGENVSCQYCKFNDICYKKEKNNIYITREKEDEENADLD